jgi:hypothetical protein
MRATLRLFFWILLLAPAPARAGAWMLPAGHGQLLLTTAFAQARNAYDFRGRLTRTPSYWKLETRAYVEHGVTDWLTLVAEGGAMRFRGGAGEGWRLTMLDFLVAEAKAGLPRLPPPAPSGPAYEGLGLGAAGLRIGAGVGAYALAVEGALRAASPEARRYLDIRDAVQVDLRALAGRSFALFGRGGFVETQIGYRSRGQNGDEIRADVAAGLRPFDRLLLLAQSFSAVAPRRSAVSMVAAQKFQVSAVYDVTAALSVQIGAVAAPGGINAPAERGAIAALWWRY